MNMFERGRRAQQGARDLGRARRHSRHDRTDRRWDPHQVRRLAVDLLSERADRGCGTGARPADHPRQSARHHASAVRRARRDRRHRRTRAAGRRDLPSTAVRLGRHANDRALGGVGGRSDHVPGDRKPRQGPAAAAVDLPAAHARRRERGRAAAGRKLLCLRVRRHPVHAAGAALQRSADRSRVGCRPR